MNSNLPITASTTTGTEKIQKKMRRLSISIPGLTVAPTSSFSSSSSSGGTITTSTSATLAPAASPWFRPRPPQPPSPHAWLWQCHVCSGTYALGVTRRCLQDGHYFCPGQTIERVTGRLKRHRACSSEFDYAGWHNFSAWRKQQQQQQQQRGVPANQPSRNLAAGGKKGSKKQQQQHGIRDCWNHCDYPSECRWGPHAYKRARLSKVPSSLAQSSFSSPSASSCGENLSSEVKSRFVEELEAVDTSSSSSSEAQQPLAQESSPSPAAAIAPPLNPLGQHANVTLFIERQESSPSTTTSPYASDDEDLASFAISTLSPSHSDSDSDSDSDDTAPPGAGAVAVSHTATGALDSNSLLLAPLPLLSPIFLDDEPMELDALAEESLCGQGPRDVRGLARSLVAGLPDLGTLAREALVAGREDGADSGYVSEAEEAEEADEWTRWRLG